MSIFNELLPKLTEISNAYIKNFNEDLKEILESIDKFEKEYLNDRGRAREKGGKDKNLTTLESINEDEDECMKVPESDQTTRRSSVKSDETSNSSNINGDETQRLSQKRSKNEVDGLSSPEQDKRQKRNASVKAQSIISKQVNVNLTQKLRREDTSDKSQSRNRRRKDEENKENEVPLLNIQIKEEKMSMPPEPMDTESLPVDIGIKQEVRDDEVAMPPPTAPVPKPRKAGKEKPPQEDFEEESSGRRRTTRNRKQTDTVQPPAAAPRSRSTRASSRAARPPPEPPRPHTPPAVQPPAVQPPAVQPSDMQPPQIPEVRPKRTRARKKVSEVTTDSEKNTTQSTQVDETASPADKRPKRTRRGRKATDKQEAPKPDPIITPKEEILSQHEAPQSPILPHKKTNLHKEALKNNIDTDSEITNKTNHKINGVKLKLVLQSSEEDGTTMNETHVLPNAIVPINDMDKTVVLPNGLYNHAPVTPKDININMNATVVLETYNRETMVLEKHTAVMDATVVIDKDPPATNITEDNSILTDDNSDVQEPQTPRKQDIPKVQPTSAVKEKVQQFEELASRVTRTKTRAMAKKEESTENQTPPDKISKPVLSAETLSKMNSLIFNGKAPQVSSSATKPRANVSSVKSFIPASTSKLSAINKAKEKEAAEESLKREKEDARKKKEAMLEAKREQQKKKREEKMAAAAAARWQAERSRLAALQAADRERRDRQAHADQGRLHRLREAERKKQELARKVLETEERRRAEEHARQQRLEEEQRRADAARRKQIEEAEAMKKEAAIMAKEIEKRQKEYIEKQKIKHKLESVHTPLKAPSTPGHPSSQYQMDPVYMADGFQYLNSDEEAEPVERPIPAWCTSKARRAQLAVQARLAAAAVDALFSVRVHCPDLRAMFPAIERARLKRTSSAVWRTPPRLASLASHASLAQ
ncbi:inner centromere protein A isoform X2 [Galleria mellonella]|uniref:Inner centromere protein A isoform X2 n=1 Tax=Galleria mellonella TaxID=7137 RepID=A0ABM3N3D3_GALME|nr:inner centromere protein A isoform X2 [Galleria mellonella]